MRDYSAQDNGEMTMEEILASIRRYVAEDMPAKPAPQAEKVVRLTEEYAELDSAPIITPPPPPSAKNEPIFSMDHSATHKTTAAVNREEPIFKQAAPTSAPSNAAFNLSSQPTNINNNASPFERLKDVIEEQKTERSKASPSHGSVSSMMSNHEGWLKDFFKEMARPFIEKWLNDNLQNIVEEMVQQEIDKVRRAGGSR